MNSRTFINTSPRIPLRSLVTRSVNWRTIFVGWSSPNLNLSYTAKGMSFTLAPESRRVRWMLWWQITIEIVGHPGSLHFRGTWFEMIELALETKNALLGTIVALLVLHKFLRKHAYGGICCITSRRGMLILTCAKVSLILSTWDYTFFPFSRLGKRGGGLETQMEGVGESLGEVESSIDSLSLGLSASLDRIWTIREGSISSHWR